MLLAMPLFVWSQKAKKKIVYRPVRSFYLDLNNDDKIDTVSISTNSLSPDTFNRISIKLAGFPKQIFKAKDGWSYIDQWFLDSNKNMVRSKQVFIKTTPVHAVIIVSGGTDGAGYGGEFSIINIENNQIKMVFDDSGKLDVELPIRLIDLRKDNRLDFVYTNVKEVYKHVKGGMIGTYVPYFVYPVTDSCKLNTNLTKTYNEANYLYAGLKFGDKIEIYYPDNKKRKPRVWHNPKSVR